MDKTTYVVQHKRNARWVDGGEYKTEDEAREDQAEGASYMPSSRVVKRTVTETEV